MRLFILPLLLVIAKMGFAAKGNQFGSIFFEKTYLDFGNVKRGEKLKAEFPFVNKGSGDLVIQGVQAPCGCTTANIDTNKKYGPGERGTIELTFDTSDFSGGVVKPVTVMTNEKLVADRTLTIAARVHASFIADPPIVDFADLTLGKSATQDITIDVAPGAKFSIEKLRFNQTFFEVTHEKKGKNWVIHVAIRPSVPIGFLKETIYVKNTSTELPELKIPVRANVLGPIQVSPNYVEFGTIEKSEKARREVSLDAPDNLDLKLSKAEIYLNGSVINAQTTDVVNGNVADVEKGKYKFNLELKNPGVGAGSVHGRAFFQTSHPMQKEVAIDFYAFFK